MTHVVGRAPPPRPTPTFAAVGDSLELEPSAPLKVNCGGSEIEPTATGYSCW